MEGASYLSFFDTDGFGRTGRGITCVRSHGRFRRKIFPNEKVARRLADIEYITSFSNAMISAKKGNRYGETVLCCWVKAVS